MFNVETIRRDFPILTRKVHGHPLIYFDNAATAQKPQAVLDIIQEYNSRWNANIHRGVHHLSNVCTEAFEKARKTTAEFIGAGCENEIIFTSGTTDSINLVADTFCRKFVNRDDEILVSQTEHHSNFVPWQQTALRMGAKFVVFDITDNGEFDMTDFERKLSPKTRIVAVSHVGNALGSVNPVKQIIEMSHRYNIPVLIDGAQAIQHLKVNVQELDADFYAFSGHKLYGPTGTGVLYGKQKWLETLPPYRFGGEMIAAVSNTGTIFNELPFKFEAGTPNYTGVTGLGKAIEYVQEIGLENITGYENELLTYFTSKIKEIDNLIIYGNIPEKAGIISFNVKGIHSYDIGAILDKMGIAVRTGNHCAQPLCNRLKIEGTVRASLAMYNTKEEADVFVKCLKKAINMLQ